VPIASGIVVGVARIIYVRAINFGRDGATLLPFYGFTIILIE
jgi:hypothetical protein